MARDKEIAELTQHFEALGAHDPEAWAKSQIEERIPQYARFIFLRQAWRHIIPDGDTSWIDPLIAESDQRPRGPGAGIGPALKRMLDAGVHQEDIADVVRVMQWHVLYGIAYQLADSSIVEYPSEEMPRVNWTLFEVDEDSQQLHPIAGLHESVLDTDPSGREMRPRGVGREG